MRRGSRIGWAGMGACVMMMGAGGAVNAHAAPAPFTHGCGGKISAHDAAPGIGNTATYPADSAGDVTLRQTSERRVIVVNVAPTAGWTSDQKDGGGPVRVWFHSPPHYQVRFTGRLDSTGRKLTVVVVVCS